MEIVWFLLAISLCANAALLYLVKKLKKEPVVTNSYEVEQLIHDLTSGSALIKITRVDHSNLFLRSPRHL